jgi:hypothetical protein
MTIDSKPQIISKPWERLLAKQIFINFFLRSSLAMYGRDVVAV